MLRGPKVVEDALWAFEEQKQGCTRRLADRLMDALEAGARAGGDRRCTPELAALSAFLFVAKPDDAPDAPSLSLVRERPGSQLRNPWRDLRRSLLLTREKGSIAENPVFLLGRAYRAQEGEAPGCE